MKIQHAKRQGWEQGSEQGLEEGIRGGEMEGPRHGRRDGTEGSRVMWELVHKRPQHAKAQQAKADKATRKQGAATSAASAGTQTHIHPTEEGEGSGEGPVVPRGPEWVDEHVRRRPSSRTGPCCHRGAIFPILTVLESHHLFGYDNASLPQPESVVSLLWTFERLSSNRS